jgi:predicted MFS family arabinose efflux permease
MSRDTRRILLAQGMRAFAYGFTSVLLGVTLATRGWSPARVGVLLTAIVGGTVVASVIVARNADAVGRRRLYGWLFFGLAASGAVFGTTDGFWVLTAVALTGTLSTEVIESGPFTSLEQTMLAAAERTQPNRTRVFGIYNAVAAVVGSVGALTAGGPALLRARWPTAPGDPRYFLVLAGIGVMGAVVARSLSPSVEQGRRTRADPPLSPASRPRVLKLSVLFALDSFGGAFVVQAFIAYWFSVRFDLPVEALGAVFFAVGLLQAASFLAATRLAARFGLLNTMVFTHLPSNLFLLAIPLAPNLFLALTFLFLRFALSQMDVPTRQAYVMEIVGPQERTAAAGYTNTARYVVRPLGPALSGASLQVAMGLPFFLGGSIKVAYDLLIWVWFRRVPLSDEREDTDLIGPGEGNHEVGHESTSKD